MAAVPIAAAAARRCLTVAAALSRPAGQLEAVVAAPAPTACSPLRRCSTAAPARPQAQAQGDPAAVAGLSATANSYISLGAFETMGEDAGRMATGIAYLQEAVNMQEAEYEAEAEPRRRSIKAVSLAQNLLQVGRQHHQQQDPSEAIPRYQRALELIEAAIEVRKEQDTKNAKKAVEYLRFIMSEICCGLGVAYNDVDRHDEALAVLQQALAVRKETMGKSHASVAECLNNIAALYFTRGSLQRAVEHYEQALELLRNGGHEDGPYIALTFYNIGVCRAGLGERQAGEVYLQQALKIAERALGSDHRQVDMIRETILQQRQSAAPAAAKERAGPPDAEGS